MECPHCRSKVKVYRRKTKTPEWRLPGFLWEFIFPDENQHPVGSVH